MKITAVESFVLLVPDFRADACSSAQDNIVVKIHSDSGHVGIGETDTNPWVAKAMIEAPGTHIMGIGLKETLIGKDPRDVEGLWEKMYVGSAMTGRRGLGICAWRARMARGTLLARVKQTCGSCSRRHQKAITLTPPAARGRRLEITAES